MNVDRHEDIAIVVGPAIPRGSEIPVPEWASCRWFFVAQRHGWSDCLPEIHYGLFATLRSAKVRRKIVVGLAVPGGPGRGGHAGGHRGGS